MKRQSLALVSAAALVLAGMASTPGRLPAHAALMSPGSIKILSPAPGTIVTGNSVAVTIAVKDFTLNCAVAGTAPKPGVGHWHLYWDTMNGSMMGMGTLIEMGCTHSQIVFTDGLKPGKHRLIAAFSDNLHAPLMSAEVASITINVQ